MNIILVAVSFNNLSCGIVAALSGGRLPGPALHYTVSVDVICNRIKVGTHH